MIILNSFLMLLGLGLMASIMLAIASKILYVWEDPRIEQVEGALLGANCGGCGYAGCAAAAEAVVKSKAELDVCTAGGFEIAQQVAEVMGKKVEQKEPDFARPGCYYGYQDADLKFTYDGVLDCRAAMLLYEGSKECHIGCLGLRTCVVSCPFNALSMGENNLPVVNLDRCTGCGVCVEVCPKDIITLSSATRRIKANQKKSECTAPCQRNCPAEIDIPEYIRQISAGNYLEAVRVIKEKNPFPLICGWVCPAPCEFECRRNLIDEPVGINALKKFVSQYEMTSGQRILPDYLPLAKGKNIVIVGGGVEGLTAAYYLRRLGHAPKVKEATDRLGGILRYVITEDRLPRNVLDWEIDSILETGIEAETGKTMGKDFSLGSMFSSGTDMVLLTTGGWDSRQILRDNIWGENIIPGSYLLLDLLIAASKNIKIDLKKKIVIIGGGSTSSRAADVCLGNGAEQVTVVLPFTKQETEFRNIELNGSKKVKYIFSATPVELEGNGDQLKSLSLRVVNDEIQKLSLDNLIVSSGRYPEMLIEKTKATQWKTVDIFKVLPRESQVGIFTIAETGRPTDLAGVVVAVGRGRKMAKAIQQYVSGEEISPDAGVIVDDKELQNIFEIADKKDLMASRGIIDNRITVDEAEARYHANRCLNCGLICYKKKLDKVNKEEISAY
ncbi:MAG: FAD-dependent oxidoreductase [Candidatus Aminicenantes bacterium]|nr:FAD-dependent oxidoreductase [Candidatus Aminicenantes bacterium]